MQSHIKIKLEFRCIVGISELERKKKQKLKVKIEAKSGEFLDYAEVLKLVKTSYKRQKFYTLESSFELISSKLKESFPSLKFIKISAFKPKIIKKARVGASFKKKFKNDFVYN